MDQALRALWSLLESIKVYLDLQSMAKIVDPILPILSIFGHYFGLFWRSMVSILDGIWGVLKGTWGLLEDSILRTFWI